MTWHRAIVAEDGTHHLLNGQPLYTARFHAVQKFHEPGLAPATDDSGAFHIDAAGRRAYAARFRQTWGFYEGRAAVEDDAGWLHIRADGTPLSAQRYAWCGNFLESRCTVGGRDGRYFHIGAEGEAAYPERYLYAGDFRDGAAVVRSGEVGRCTHVGTDGRPIHGQWFVDLDVFHKGFARARDDHGWFHIDRRGQPAYSVRFVAVEPFYNGRALCEAVGGDRLIVDQSGQTVHRLDSRVGVSGERLPRKVLLIGNIGVGKTTVGTEIARLFGWRLQSIDQHRRRRGDGSPSGELGAWSSFVAAAEHPSSQVLEFSGSGPMVYLVRMAVERSGTAVLIVWLRAPVEVCLARVAGRSWSTPYPDFGVPLAAVIRDLDRRLAAECEGQDRWQGLPLRTVDGAPAREEVLSAVLDLIETWKRSPHA